MSVESSAIGLHRWDFAANRFSSCDVGAAQVHGVSIADFFELDYELGELIHPDDRQILKAARGKSEAGQLQQIEFRIVDRTGRVRKIRRSSHCEFDKSGTAIAEIGFCQEVVDLVAGAGRSTESGREMEWLFEASPIPFMHADLSSVRSKLKAVGIKERGDLADAISAMPELRREIYDALWPVRISTNFAKLYGATTVAEFLPWLDFCNADTGEVDRFCEAMEALYLGETEYQYECDETTISGAPLRTRIRFSLPDGYIDGWPNALISTEDVTKQHQRTRRATDAAKFEAIGRLAGGIAHDFNNLLHAIRSATGLALEGEDGKDRLLRQIEQATINGAELTKSILSFTGLPSIETHSTSVAALIEDTAPLLRSLMGHDVELSLKRGCEPWTVDANPGQLTDAIINLLMNSRQAMPDGGEVFLSTRVVPATDLRNVLGLRRTAEQFVEISVTDGGTGISKRDAERAFDPYFTTKLDGTGLGLSSVYGFAVNAGGMVTIEGKDPTGTIVRILLPALQSAPDQRQQPSQFPAIKHAKGLRVLLVEDTHEIRDLLKLVLERNGYHVEARCCADEIVDSPQELDEFDLIVSDLLMPGKSNGLDLLNLAATRNPGQRQVLMTGNPNLKVDSKMPYDRGAKILRKPFSNAELLSVVEDAIEGR